MNKCLFYWHNFSIGGDYIKTILNIKLKQKTPLHLLSLKII
jgi:hypothetical protein